MAKRWLPAVTGLFLSLALLLAAAPRAEANPGLRLGLTDDPDTLFVGFFYEAPLSWAGSGFFAVEPGVDLGFGEDVDFFTIRGTVNGKYLIPVGSVWLYPILGLSIYYVNVDDCPAAADCDDTGAGLNLGLGMRIDRFNMELTAGIEDVPDVVLNVGFLF
ncbi:MAG TPA: hypothetical protein VKZ63_01290 [Kofleriaceae bacterium]|nr:hypothetical protein [Kofleriaceae bacterium]